MQRFIIVERKGEPSSKTKYSILSDSEQVP
jgi:hypothetical protein